jgi:hypothetical protein
MRNFLRLAAILSAVALSTMAASCDNDADVASRNLSQEADNFRIARRIIFLNGFTNDYIFEVRGWCSLGSSTSSKGITVTCKTSPGEYKKHILGLSDNVTYFVEQLDAKKVSVDFYQVTFKPTAILPDFKLEVGNGPKPPG